MTGYPLKQKRSFRVLPVALGLLGLFFAPYQAIANDAEPEALRWARVDFLRNRVQLLPASESARRAQISDILQIGDSLRTMRQSRAELRFNDNSLARIGERATFRFTPNTRNFQLTNGTVLLLIPPGKGRSTIQTPNAVTGIQGSALFVRYIPETDTTIVGALTDNPEGPMVLFNRDGTEQQALQANEIGVIEGGQITELYRFDSALFWESSGLAEGFNYEQDSTSTGDDALDGVRQEIREAISKQAPLPSNGAGVIENPSSFSRPEADAPVSNTDAGNKTPDGSEPSGNAAPNTDNEREPKTSNGEGAASGSTNGESSGTTGTVGSGAASGTNTAAVSAGSGNRTGSGAAGSAVEPSTGDVLKPVSGAEPTSNVVEDTVSEQDLAEAEEPVVELEFKGTPAEAYLAAPLVDSSAQPATDGGSKLVPTTPAQPTEESSSPNVDAKPLANQDDVPAPRDVVVPGDSPINDRDSLGGIDGRRPLTDSDSEDSDKTPDTTKDPTVEEGPESPVSGSAEPNSETVNDPTVDGSIVEDTAEPPPESSPASTEPPAESPSISPPTVDDVVPLLPADGENPEVPILLESKPTPEAAVPATLPSGPTLDPSTTLIPVLGVEGVGESSVPLVQPEAPAGLVLPEAAETPERSVPARASNSVIDNVTPPLAAPGSVIPANPNSVPTVPETVLDTVIMPEAVESPLTTEPPIIEGFDSSIPFDEPEVGGTPLDGTLNPVDVPEQIGDDVPTPRPLLDNSDNLEDNSPIDENDPTESDPNPQPPEPLEERVLL